MPGSAGTATGDGGYAVGMFRKRAAASGPQAGYERARRDYRRSLRSFTASVLVSVLVLGLVAPVFASAILGDTSRVFTGPVDGRYGARMVPIAAYGVDLNKLALNNDKGYPSYGDFSEELEAKGPLGGLFSSTRESEVMEFRADKEAAYSMYDMPPNPAVAGETVYVLPDFLVFGGTVGSLRPFKAGDSPIYIPIDGLKLAPGESLQDLTWERLNSVKENLIDGTGSPDLPFRIVIASRRANARTQQLTSPDRGDDATFDISNGDAISPVYSSKEAYVFFSPKSAAEQYAILMDEYAGRQGEFNSLNTSPASSAQAGIESGMYLAMASLLEAYLKEALPQDGSRGWGGVSDYSDKAWLERVADATQALTGVPAINNTLAAGDPGTGEIYTHDQLADKDTVYHKGGTNDGIFVPPYHPIQFHAMPTEERLYRFQVIGGVDLGSLTEASASQFTKAMPPGFDTFFTPDNKAADAKVAAETGSLTSVQAVLLADMAMHAQGTYTKSRNESYAPLKAKDYDLYLARISPARTPGLYKAVFAGYKPVGDIDPAMKDPLTTAKGSLYFAWPSFGPSISGRMADGQSYNVVNAELGGIVTIAESAFEKFKSLIGSALLGPAGTLTYAMQSLQEKNAPNNVGWAWSEEYSADDPAYRNLAEETDSSVTDDDKQEPNIDGDRAVTGRPAVYTGRLTVQRTEALQGYSVPYAYQATGSLYTDTGRQMAQQAYQVDLSLASLGGFGSLNPDAIVGQQIAKAAESLLRAGVSIFQFSFGSSSTISSSIDARSKTPIIGQWKNPFTILVSDPGLGPIYEQLQALGLLFVALFSVTLGFAHVLSASTEGGDDAWPLSFGMKSVNLKMALPRIVVAILMIGLPSGMAGGTVLPGLSYWIASFVVMMNDTLCSIMSVSASSQFMTNLAAISGTSGQSAVSALVFALIAFVMFWAFVAGAVMLLFRTLFLYIFILIGPLVWAFWVLEKGSSPSGKFSFSSLNGSLPKHWLQAVTQLAFVQAFWVLCFFVITQLFSDTQVTASIFGLRTAGASTVTGMAAAHAFSPMQQAGTALTNSVDLILRAIIICVAFGVMLKIASSSFQMAAVSGMKTAESALSSLKDAAMKPVDRAAATAERYGKAALDPKQLSKELRADANGLRDRGIRTAAKVQDAKKKAGAAGAMAKDLATKDGRRRAGEDAMKRLSDRGSQWLDDGRKAIADGDVDVSAAEAAKGLDRGRAQAERALREGERRARAAYTADEWAELSETQREHKAMEYAKDALKDQGLTVMDEDAMAEAGLRADGSFRGSQGDLDSVNASKALIAMQEGLRMDEATAADRESTRAVGVQAAAFRGKEEDLRAKALEEIGGTAAYRAAKEAEAELEAARKGLSPAALIADQQAYEASVMAKAEETFLKTEAGASLAKAQAELEAARASAQDLPAFVESESKAIRSRIETALSSSATGLDLAKAAKEFEALAAEHEAGILPEGRMEEFIEKRDAFETAKSKHAAVSAAAEVRMREMLGDLRSRAGEIAGARLEDAEAALTAAATAAEPTRKMVQERANEIIRNSKEAVEAKAQERFSAAVEKLATSKAGLAPIEQEVERMVAEGMADLESRFTAEIMGSRIASANALTRAVAEGHIGGSLMAEAYRSISSGIDALACGIGEKMMREALADIGKDAAGVLSAMSFEAGKGVMVPASALASLDAATRASVQDAMASAGQAMASERHVWAGTTDAMTPADLARILANGKMSPEVAAVISDGIGGMMDAAFAPPPAPPPMPKSRAAGKGGSPDAKTGRDAIAGDDTPRLGE